MAWSLPNRTRLNTQDSKKIKRSMKIFTMAAPWYCFYASWFCHHASPAIWHYHDPWVAPRHAIITMAWPPWVTDGSTIRGVATIQTLPHGIPFMVDSWAALHHTVVTVASPPWLTDGGAKILSSRRGKTTPALPPWWAHGWLPTIQWSPWSHLHGN